jgi:flagellar basal-body rod protein FlgC
MNVIATNLANVNTTRTKGGGPYRRMIALVESRTAENFGSVLNRQVEALNGVRVGEIVEEATPFRRVYNPDHPDADQSGYVLFPNVNVITETAELMTARRSYEANVAAISVSKRMALKALQIGK